MGFYRVFGVRDHIKLFGARNRSADAGALPRDVVDDDEASFFQGSISALIGWELKQGSSFPGLPDRRIPEAARATIGRIKNDLISAIFDLFLLHGGASNLTRATTWIDNFRPPLKVPGWRRQDIVP